MIVVLPSTWDDPVSLFRVIIEGVPYVVSDYFVLYGSFCTSLQALSSAYRGKEVRIPEWI